MVVECRSESAYPEKPLAVWWEEQRLEICKILAQWRTPQGKVFRVYTQGDRIFELFYIESSDQWHVTPL